MADWVRVVVVEAWLMGVVACGFPRPADVSDDAAPKDAQLCYGNFSTICLEAAPTQPVTISDPTTVDTVFSPVCVASDVSHYCVIAGTTISIESTLRAIGTRPLVLIATTSLVIKPLAQIDVASYRALPLTRESFGARGGEPCDAGSPPLLGANNTTGGGAGGSFGGFGGRGGTGGSGGGAGGTPNDPVTMVAGLRGGCNGQDGLGPGTTSGGKGPGGGAVYLVAGSAIDISGTINASGGGGGAGGSVACAGGGGGGSGGMIVVDAATIIATGTLLANGGGGGEGTRWGDSAIAMSGEDPKTLFPADGGHGGSQDGGDGGDGSAGPAAGRGQDGSSGTTSNACGGGGGGGAGVIKAPATARLGPLVSPAATPW